MLSVQQISDRMEIDMLLAGYSHALDGQDWDALRALFTDDAVIDYTEMGGPRGDPPAIVEFLRATMPALLSYQHLVATSRVDLDGDRATGRTICFNPMVLPGGPEPRVFFCGLWYRDVFVRTPAGWRFSARHEERSYFYDFPGGTPAGLPPSSHPPAPPDAR